ncbi:MAG: type I phosphomannose isomerase catalytic subunit [Candidatus Promineifilaceae bacterium]
MREFPYPLLFEPVLKDYVWGGRRLSEMRAGRRPPDRVAESWEVAMHPHGRSLVAAGPCKGLDLGQLMAAYGEALLGTHGRPYLRRGHFPLLVKVLDAERRLSLQVHPDDAYAGRHENGSLGKTEMWVILEAGRDAKIVLGLSAPLDRAEFKHALTEGHIMPWLHHLPVQVGDFVCVPARSLHAILGDIMLVEVQQNSDITYRAYDWGRPGASRPLHLRQALEVIDFGQVRPGLPAVEPLAHDEDRGWQAERLCANDYFQVERYHVAAGGGLERQTEASSLEIWALVAGRASLGSSGEQAEFDHLGFVLLPAALGVFGWQAHADATLLRITLTEPGAVLQRWTAD